MLPRDGKSQMVISIFIFLSYLSHYPVNSSGINTSSLFIFRRPRFLPCSLFRSFSNGQIINMVCSSLITLATALSQQNMVRPHRHYMIRRLKASQLMISISHHYASGYLSPWSVACCTSCVVIFLFSEWLSQCLPDYDDLDPPLSH
jgi:hypothetical protein